MKEDVEMRSAFAAGVRQLQKPAAVYCVRLDSVQNGNAFFREEKSGLDKEGQSSLRGTRLLCILNLLISLTWQKYYI